MRNYLVTGIGGFVGRYFWEYLVEHERDFRVLGIDMLPEASWKHPAFYYRQLNLMNEKVVRETISEFQPDYIVHLAAISSVAQSWKMPRNCFINNSTIFLNLVEEVRLTCPAARMLSVGSSEEYGSYPVELMPLQENYTLKPCNPYAAARTAQETLSQIYADSYGLKIMLTRSFSHTGPRQRDTFVIPSFVKQLVNIKKNGGKGSLRTGNLDVVRDFLDVRDVVDAYWRILTQGRPGEVYNVCSGKGVRLQEVITTTAELLGIEPAIETDPALIRSADTAVIIGDNSKLRETLGWTQVFSLEQTLKDMILSYSEE
ncbi:GDP-mannose 4,6-dehydratase [uncultured Mailhella sp.]|uniref:GDP-mannose 4,6-dehydratase n=1 Tax=uncultured Mailhella sp. TaxID=1981031 RepID=UPI00263314BB|nr:GDP-mannose 4,6-dehydratase [uncultured Mailhella sp.]